MRVSSGALEPLLDDAQAAYLEQVIPRLVPKGVVDRLEAIEINEQQADAAVAVRVMLLRMAEDVIDHTAVGQAGNRIGMRQNIHAQDVGIKPVHHAAEAVGQTADLAGTLHLYRQVHVAAGDGLGGAVQGADRSRQFAGRKKSDAGGDEHGGRHSRHRPGPDRRCGAEVEPEIGLSARAQAGQHKAEQREADGDAVEAAAIGNRGRGHTDARYQLWVVFG